MLESTERSMLMNKENRNELNLYINKLKDEELKEKIINMNKDQLTIIRNMSYYYLIGNISETVDTFKKENILGDNTREREIIQKNLSQIIDSFNNYHLILSEERMLNEKEKLINIRKELYKLANTLYGYSIELSYIKEILYYKEIKNMPKNRFNNYKISRNDINYLINKITITLDRVKNDYNKYNTLISKILLLVPFRMSKLKYYEVLKSSLLRNFDKYAANMVESMIEDYKMKFNSTLLGDYGILFDEYFTEIQKLKIKNMDGKEDEKEVINKDIEELSKRINQSKLFITNMGIIINKMLVLYLTKGMVDELNDNDIYSKFKKFIRNQKKDLLEILIETSNKKLEKNEKDLLNRTNEFEVLVHESTRRGIVFEDELNSEIKYTGKILAYYNDITFTRDEILFPESYGIIDKNYLEQLIDSLIHYINRSISSMNNLERKIRMRRLLSQIDLPFNNIEEFLYYIEYSLDERVVSMEEIILTFYTLDELLEEFVERQ